MSILRYPTNLPVPQDPDDSVWVNKFGRNADVDSGTVADVYDNGVVGGALSYPWPAAAAATTVVSSSAADAAAGTGARTVEVQGLDENYSEVSEEVALAGATPVALTTQFLRVFRAKVLTAGSGGTNAGSVDVKHTSTVLARVSIGFGQTLMAIYTTPANRVQYLASWHGSTKHTATGVLAFRLDVRPFGGAWNCKETFETGGRASGSFRRTWPGWQKIDPKSDIRIRVYGGSDNTTVVSAGFDLFKRY